jgi:hypothetical protein
MLKNVENKNDHQGNTILEVWRFCHCFHKTYKVKIKIKLEERGRDIHGSLSNIYHN